MTLRQEIPFFTYLKSNIKNLFGQKFTLIQTFKTKKKYWQYLELCGRYNSFSDWKPCFEKNDKQVLEWCFSWKSKIFLLKWDIFNIFQLGLLDLLDLAEKFPICRFSGISLVSGFPSRLSLTKSLGNPCHESPVELRGDSGTPQEVSRESLMELRGI